MSNRNQPKDPSAASSIKGCAEYRLAAELTLLRRRLLMEDLDKEERRAVEQRVQEIEKALGV